VYIFFRQFVTYFVLRFVEYKHACQQLQCRTSKRGRRALFVTLLSVFKLPVTEAFYIARCYIIVDKLFQRVYIHVTVMSKTATYGWWGRYQLLKTMMTFWGILHQPIAKAECFHSDYT